MSFPTKDPDSRFKSTIQRGYLCVGALSANTWHSVTDPDGAHGNFLTRGNAQGSSVATTYQEAQFNISAQA